MKLIFKRILSWMASNSNFLFFTFAILVLVMYLSKVSYLNISAKITRVAPTPVAFFNREAPLLDFPTGNLVKANEECQNVDVCIMFLYAPWDSESVQAKSQIEETAQLFLNEVLFVAINCWQPDGSCALNLKLNRYPRLIVQVRGVKAISLPGPIVTGRLTALILRLLRPMTLLRTSKQLHALRATYDNVVLGYFNFRKSPQPAGYFSFYSTSLAFIETEDYRSTAFAIVPVNNVNIRNRYNMTRNGDIVLLTMSNETGKSLKTSSTISPQNLLNFIVNVSIKPLVAYMEPRQTKSLRLDKMLRNGPAFILSLKDNVPPSTAEFYRALIRDLALSYTVCNATLSKPYSHQMDHTRQQRLALLTDWRQLCDDWRRIRRPPVCCRAYYRHRYHHLSLDPCPPTPTNYSPSYADVFGQHDSQESTPSSQPLSPPPFRAAGCSACSWESQSFDKSETPLLKEQWHAKRLLRHHLGHTSKDGYRPLWSSPTSSLPSASQDYNFLLSETLVHPDPSIDTAAHRLLNLACAENFPLQGSVASVMFPHPPRPLTSTWKQQQPPRNSSTDEDEPRIDMQPGVHCKFNRSINFHTLDMSFYSQLADNLGFDLESKSLIQFAILDWKNEALYQFSKSPTYNNLVGFITDFHRSRLEPHLRSANPVPSPVCNSLPSANKKMTECLVTSVTTRQLDQLTQRADRNMVLLFTARWCGFCSAFYHFVVTLARHYRGYPRQNPILFAKIDIADNDLHWNYQPEYIPSILFFPKGRYADSSSLALNASVGLLDLISFVERNLQVPPNSLPDCDQNCITVLRSKLRRNAKSLRSRKRQLDSNLALCEHRLSGLNSLLWWSRWEHYLHRLPVLWRAELDALTGAWRRRLKRLKLVTDKIYQTSVVLESISGKRGPISLDDQWWHHFTS